MDTTDAADPESKLRLGHSARREGRLDDALRLLNEALGLCSAGQNYERAHILRELAELARAGHDLPLAQQHYEASAALLRDCNDPLRLAHTIRHLGDVLAARQLLPQSETCFVEALDLYRANASSPPLDFANAMRSYAALLSDTGRHEQALPLWREAGAIYKWLDIEAGAAECLKRVGDR